MSALLAALAGVVFAIGLVVSDMTSPSRIIDFLAFEDWTLAFVMAGAIAVYAPAVRLVRKTVHWPTHQAIDARLVIGSAIFGIGWGLSGYCPGPALVSVGASIATGVFVLAMIAGMAIARRI
ncbi:MAG: hypothetical protein M4D80_00595 [Myxococcota bacterium]|nr:hypothetical protein [Myxococcota bacterium]